MNSLIQRLLVARTTGTASPALIDEVLEQLFIGKPATAADPYSWHSCRAGKPGWWGMAPRQCDAWTDPVPGNSADPLALELARLAQLDVAKMLASGLSEADWERLASASVLLSERQPDCKSGISALLARIDAAYSARVTP